MPDPMCVTIADAVVAAINAGTFSPVVTAVRKFEVQTKLQDADTLAVTVVPKSKARTLAGRADDRVDYVIDVGVQQKFSPADDVDTQMAELLNLVEDIDAWMNRRDLSQYEATVGATWIGSSNEPIWSPEHLETLRQFTSVLSLTYRDIE